jgi:hypothetical protein
MTESPSHYCCVQAELEKLQDEQEPSNLVEILGETREIIAACSRRKNERVARSALSETILFRIVLVYVLSVISVPSRQKAEHVGK